MAPPRVLGSSFSEGSQEPVGPVRRLAMIAVWSGHRVRNFLPYNKRCEGRHDEKGRKKGPDSLAFVWPLGTGKSKTQTCREPTVETGRTYRTTWPPGPLAAWFSCLKMTFLSFSSKLPSTLTSVRRYAPEPCGMGRSAPSATWTSWSTSWW